MIIYANLDCEASWAGVALPRAVLERISAASALLAALAPAGELVEIYAPAAIDPARVRLPGVTMRAGAPARWDLAWADPGAKAANDRRATLALAERLGVALPGTCVVDSLAALDAALAALGDRAWVAKAPYTAAGRDRVRGQGPLAGEARVHAERLLARHGALVVEPWLDRVLDLGWCATLPAHGPLAARTPHTLRVDARGGFSGIDVAAPELTDAETRSLEAVLGELPRHLRELGYAGPLAIDAFVYRDERGARRLHPLCELNARHTFGHVTHALCQRFGARTLGFGAPPEGAQVLVAPGERDPVAAWMM